jgi:hypothetical protein
MDHQVDHVDDVVPVLPQVNETLNAGFYELFEII